MNLYVPLCSMHRTSEVDCKNNKLHSTRNIHRCSHTVTAPVAHTPATHPPPRPSPTLAPPPPTPPPPTKPSPPPAPTPLLHPVRQPLTTTAHRYTCSPPVAAPCGRCRRTGLRGTPSSPSSACPPRRRPARWRPPRCGCSARASPPPRSARRRRAPSRRRRRRRRGCGRRSAARAAGSTRRAPSPARRRCSSCRRCTGYSEGLG